LQKLNGIDKQDFFQALEGIKLSIDERNCLTIEADHLPEKVITNDIVELIDNERFKWLGRFDNVINSGGVKIIPEKVEAVLKLVFSELNLTVRYFIAGIADQKLGFKVVLVIEGEENDTIAILKKAQKKLTKYELPKEVFYVPEFIETETQKIDRKKTLKVINR